MEIQKSKTVMISYVERNKLLKIPDSAESDLKFLTEEFRREFKFDLVVTFQRFDSEWGGKVLLKAVHLKSSNYNVLTHQSRFSIVTGRGVTSNGITITFNLSL